MNKEVKLIDFHSLKEINWIKIKGFNLLGVKISFLAVISPNQKKRQKAKIEIEHLFLLLL